MPFLSRSDLNERELIPGFHVRLMHTDRMTVAHFRIERGASLPSHFHAHEQITNILEGQFEMTVGDETRICGPGDVVVIPGHTPHHGRALSDCYLIDVFQPTREDYVLSGVDFESRTGH